MRNLINWIFPSTKSEKDLDQYKSSVTQFVIDLESGEFDIDFSKVFSKPYAKIIDSRSMFDMINMRRKQLKLAYK